MSKESDCLDKHCSVQVAIRIRPQNSRELIDMCHICTTVTPGEPQVILGLDKAFTFDYVFDVNSIQGEIFSKCVEQLVEGALQGYNATVLAYGQTGSGKTFTMGTGFDHDISEVQQGIIPRALNHIFTRIENMQYNSDKNVRKLDENLQFSVAVQFIELYNEDLIDLLNPYCKDKSLKIHEDGNGQISISGASLRPVHGPLDALKYLKQGALARTTASTQMNDQSSRSHALFTILIRRQQIISSTGSNGPVDDLETFTAKFHFVDLAGSERLKRTGATGERAREGISINCGLLALGNCISALGDKSRKAMHVPYRDSKLTRLLQDSLGGNSRTIMVACVSPCDRDFMETLNTLKYANRARNIKNKVVINQDQNSRIIAQLRREIAALQLELLEFKQGKHFSDFEGNLTLSDTFTENAMLLSENKRLQHRIKAMQQSIDYLSLNNAQLQSQRDIHACSSTADSSSADPDPTVQNMVIGYITEIEKLNAKLIESKEMYQQVNRSKTIVNSYDGADPEDLIILAKKELEKHREVLNQSGKKENNTVNENCSDSDPSDIESDDKDCEIQADLNDINYNIEIKSKLIEQLELSQHRMKIMRQHYEEKLSILNNKILNTQKERDDVIANVDSRYGNESNDRVKRVQDEYEHKLYNMQRELKKLQQAEREYTRQQREIKAQEGKLRNLHTELAELKCIKTRLIRKMTEQTNRHKKEDNMKTREIEQLRKDHRRQQNIVKSLQVQMHTKDQILKRKTEEVSSLRRNKRSYFAQRFACAAKSKQGYSTFNIRRASQRLENIQRAIVHAVRNKEVVVQFENELERLVNERGSLIQELSNLGSRQENMQFTELLNDEDSIKANLSYVQSNITNVQQAIMEIEEGKLPAKNNIQKLESLIESVQNIDEAKFLLERLCNSVIMFSYNLALSENRLLEQEALFREMKQESGIQQQLLQYFLSQNNGIQIADLFESLQLSDSKHLSGSRKSLNSCGTYDIPHESIELEPNTPIHVSTTRSPSPASIVDISTDKANKIRRRTAQAQDLLFGDNSFSGIDAMSHSFQQQRTLSHYIFPLMRVPSAPGSLKQ